MLLDWLAFYLAIQVAAAAALPLALRIFAPLSSGGYPLAKFLGVLLLSYAAWLLGMFGFVQHGRGTLVVGVVAIGLTCWAIWGGLVRAALPSRRVILATEALFLVAFGLASVVRAYNPDINGQEKFMDFALMNAFYSALSLPTHDPWLAGYGVPYYYFGYFMMASVAQLSGVAASVGYNLALALVLALTALMTASLVFDALAARFRRSGATAGDPREPRVASRRPVAASAFLWAGIAAMSVTLLGNFEAPLELLAAQGIGDAEFWRAVGIKGLEPAAQAQGWPPSSFNWFRTSRVIPNIEPDGISEFPYFSFLLGDLHPHYQALPFDLLILALALALLVGGSRRFGWMGLVVSGLVLGSLLAANTWDVPAFWLIFAAALGWTAWREGAFPGRDPRRWAGLLAPFGIGVALFLPYFVGYQSQRLGLALVAERTPLLSLLIVLGPPLVVVGLYACWGVASGTFWNGLAAARSRAKGGTVVLSLGGLAVLAVELALTEWTLFFLTLLLLLILPQGLAFAKSDAELASGGEDTLTASGGHREGEMTAADAVPHGAWLPTWFMVVFGLLILIGTELIFLYDSFGSRMNTVFKFHYNAWLLLGVGAALTLALMVRERRRALFTRPAVGVVLAAVVGLGMLYPVTATYVKSDRFRGTPTLDGAHFLAQGRSSDYQAIAWLGQQSSDRPVVVEAVGPDYQEFARVSTFSGLPTVLGWIGHEVQWRGQAVDLLARERDVEAIYRAADETAVLGLLERYGASYVFVGSLERAKYGPSVDARFARLLEPAFEAGETTVYRVPGRTSTLAAAS